MPHLGYWTASGTDFLSSELFNLEIRNKTAENKCLGKVTTSYAELQQAAVADEKVGNNDGQQKL